ncbi:MAG: TfoX/Sxy family protein [Chloroflexota bacterium]
MPAKTKSPRPKSQTPKMEKFKPAPDWIKELFADTLGDFPMAEQRKMFGYPCAFVNGQMFVGVFGDKLMMRLAEAERAKFLKLEGAKQFEPMPGRAMKEYVEVPDEILKSAELKKWLKKSLAYAQSLPPKVKKTAGTNRKTAGKI